MAPVPIYSQSPINATTADGVTPQTEAAVASNGQASRHQNPPATTSASSARYAPPPAQPGAAPSLPAPTGGAAAVPTATAKVPKYSPPPPPQPGAAPVPPRTSHPPAMNSSPPQAQQTTPPALAAPPKASSAQIPALGRAAAPASAPAPAPAAPPTTAMPPQMAMPPLTSTPYPGAARGTATATAPATSVAPTPTTPLPATTSAATKTAATTQNTYPAIPAPTGALVSQGLAADHRVLDHPPGYVQNAYATDMNSSQREAALAASSRLSSVAGGVAGEGIGGVEDRRGARRSGSIGEEPESLWDAAKKLAATAGERLQAAESEVWRRINKEE